VCSQVRKRLALCQDRILTCLAGKKTSRLENSILDEQDASEEDEGAQDATGEEPSYEILADPDFAIEPKTEITQDLLPESEDRRSTFTFTLEPEVLEGSPDHEMLYDYQGGDDQEFEVDVETEDATIARLFRSPAKETPSQSPKVLEHVQYPELPHSDDELLDPDTESVPIAVEEPAVISDFEEGSPDAEEREVGMEEQRVEPIEQEIPLAEVSSTEAQQAPSDIAYPTLPMDCSLLDDVEPPVLLLERTTELVEEDVASSDVVPVVCADQIDSEDCDMENDVEASADEEFTEASIQLDIQREFEETEATKQPALAETQEDALEVTEAGNSVPEDENEIFMDGLRPANVDGQLDAPMVDITDGLTLSFTPVKTPSLEPTPRKLHSPPPPLVQSGPEDATMTIALDDDTALLKDFLNRAAASKAEKAAVMTHRRESLQNRRDSDVVRHALASPRKVLEDKDPNSPSKYDHELTLDLSQNLTLTMDPNTLVSPTTNSADNEDLADEKSLRGSRRSSRTKKSRLPAPASATQAPTQTSKIAIRRADGTEHVVLKKSDAQELSTVTRANTRKNKQGAFCVTVRLLKLAAEAGNLPPLDDSTREIIIGKNIRWDEQLAYYQENPETVADRESLSTPDELSMPEPTPVAAAKPKSKVSKTSTPKIRRVRGLGTANGTPGKVLLAPPPFLAEPAVEEEPQPTQIQQQLPRPKSSKIKKMPVASASLPDTKLPTLDIVPVGVDPSAQTQRKSRLAAPKKVTLPQSLAAEGKENANANMQRAGLGGATPRKGLPVPKVVVPSTIGVESGLPRRRGRKI
jgi:hypothetical protein